MLEADLDWTAARCQRLLRPLALKLAGLIERTTIAQDTANDTIRRHTEDFTSCAPHLEEGRPRKRLKRTYKRSHAGSQRDPAGPQQRKRYLQILDPNINVTPSPGKVILPTPFIRRFSQAPECCDSTHIESARARYSQCFCCAALDVGTKSRATRRISSAHGIQSRQFGAIHAFATLLRATRARPGSRPRDRSLLSACLRAVPRYIDYEQDLFQERAMLDGLSNIEVRSAGQEIYEELEGMGTARGWKHLRTLVRAHGVHLLCQALDRGFFEGHHVDVLLDNCHMDHDKDIIEALLRRICSPSLDDFTNTSRESRLDLAKRTIIRQFTTRRKSSMRLACLLLTEMLCERRIALDWLTTPDFQPVWPLIIQELEAETSDCFSMCMERTLLLLAMQIPSLHLPLESKESGCLPVKALENTYHSLLVTLTFLAIIRAAEANVYGNIIFTHHATLREGHGLAIDVPRSLVGLALIMSNDKHGTTEHELEHIDFVNETAASTQSSSTADHSLIKFVLSVARCCGRTGISSGLGYLQRIHQTLEITARNLASPQAAIVRDIITESALRFAAEEQYDLQNLYYAERLSNGLRFDQDQTPSANKIATLAAPGFRWEEGLGEWVKTTPKSILFPNKASALMRVCLDELGADFDAIEDAGVSSLRLAKRPRPMMQQSPSCSKMRTRDIDYSDYSEDELNDSI